MPKNAILKRFWSKVEIKDLFECWEWKHCKSGYPTFSYDLREMPANRVCWTLIFGEIPEGLFVCHHCDNPKCVNPAHLFLGTHRDNMIDMHKKGRHRVKENHYENAKKLQKVDIKAIRKSNEHIRKIADRYGITQGVVTRIKHHKHWL